MSYVFLILGTLGFVWLISLEIRVRKLQPFLSLVDVAVWFVRNFGERSSLLVNKVDNDDDLR